MAAVSENIYREVLHDSVREKKYATRPRPATQEWGEGSRERGNPANVPGQILSKSKSKSKSLIGEQ